VRPTGAAAHQHSRSWLALFTLLLCIATAVPVFASPAQGAENESPSAAEVPAPSASEIAKAELEERERAEWLSSPEAERQREASQSAYASLPAGEAQSLLLEAFPGQLKQLNGDPARVLSTLEVEKPLGTYAARVEAGEGESAILDSSVPVESEVGGEGKEPVDLTLERSGSSFVPQNPITEVELPGSAEEPILLQSGVEVELPASNDHGAEPIGAMNLFYPETETATDTLVAPRAGGVEVFEQLRSPESPERFSFALNLPNEATLRPSEAGGAEVVTSSGQVIEEVPPPAATDAQGATVPVTTSIEGDSLILEVPHRSREVAYPLLLDPNYVNNTTNFSEWQRSEGWGYYLGNPPGSLDAFSWANHYYPANTNSQWVYAAVGETAYIAAATFSPIYFLVDGCYTSQPHGYVGLYNIYSGVYNSLGVYAGGTISNAEFQTGWVGGYGTRDAMIGIGTGSSAVDIGCNHELFVGGYSIQEEDPEAPAINWVGGTSANWVKDITATPHVSDPGLGVKGVTLSPEGSLPHTNSQGCTGANGSRCPGSWETSFGVSYFAEGERSASVTAYDPLGPDVSAHVSSSSSFTTKLDRQKPEVELEGEFTEALEEAEEEGEGKKAPALHLPVYNLKIEATDKANEGNPKTEPKARRSGVKDIAIFLDGKELKVPWGAQGCSGPEYSCPMNETYPVPLNEVQGSGVHHLKVVATDQVGNEREREIEFEYFPATGMKDEYVMQHFPLPDGEGNEAEEEHPNRPELAVNVMNGNLVYRQKDLEITGPAGDLEVERFYNSQLPTEDNTEWGEGWTLAQTPKLEPEETKEAPPSKASMVRASGAFEGAVGLPTEPEAQRFDTKLQAVVTKEPGGGYAVADQSGESDNTLAFDEAGRVTEARAPGSATVNYSYEGGELSEIAVDDPATAGGAAERADEEPAKPYIYVSAVSGEGSGPGNLSAPDATASDAEGNVWVSDAGHNRVQEFGSKGEFKLQFGATGTGNGQFTSMHAIAVNQSTGNLYVAAASRVQEFNSKGEYLRQWGATGTATGKFELLRGVAIDPEGHVWTLEAGLEETFKPRLQEFSAEGTYIAQFGSEGTGNGQFKEPQGLAIDAKANVWVADTGNDRVEEFNPKGEFLRKLGAEGAGNGQLKEPAAIAADAEGNVWVADTGNDRTQEFSATATYLSQFGKAGANDGQFSEPRGIAIDAKGNVWVADTGNNRVQEWVLNEPPGEEEAPPVEPDPTVEVNTSSGLVSSVEGEEAGQTTYEHEGEMLTSVASPESETKYKYDEAKRLTKVELPNGTWGEISYESYSRVKSVTVSIEGGKAKTTSFAYKDEPRRTTVSPEGEPATVYDMAPDGSVLKWWNTQVPPEIENLSGSLYANRETAEAITPGDYDLLVQAFSVEGIASIQIVANGDQLVDEKTCEKTEETSCKTVEDPWVTNTGNWPPGILQLEVIVTDSFGKTESTRFWVNIPYTPPPDPEAPEPPKFEDVLHFREEFGLDLDLKGNEIAIDERIFNLIGDWNNPHIPAGEVARATMGRWGVPLRAVDVAEMEYRERYAAEAARLIPGWAEAHAQSTYAGYYIDQRQGGIIHVGFTSASQSQELSQLIAEIGEIAPGRISTFEGQPHYSYKELLEAWRADSAALSGQPIAKSMVSQAIDMANNKVEVKTEDVAGTESFLAQHSDPGEFEVIHTTGRLTLKSLATQPAEWPGHPKYNVREAEKRIFGGDALMDTEGGYLYECTAGWGATEPGGTKPNGEVTQVPYVITAGHCFSKGPTVRRFAREGKQFVEFPIGSVTARAFGTPVEGHETDAEAVRLRSGFSPPSWIFANKGYQLRPGAPEVPVAGEPVCHSGVEGGNTCGTVERLTEQWLESFPEWLWETNIFSCDGDSGGPYWRPEGNTPLGIETGGSSHLLPDGRECGRPEYFTPLLESKAEEMGVVVGRNVGVFQAPGLSNMRFHGAVN
jgi:sugar lactone lactonase YvrE